MKNNMKAKKKISMCDKYDKDEALLTWIEIMKKHCSDNKSFIHALESFENDLKRELPSKERTALMKSVVNSVYGMPKTRIPKTHELKGNHCDMVFMDEFETQ